MFIPIAKKFNTVSEACRIFGVSYLGGINTSAKIEKNKKVSGHYTYIIYLAPANTSGINVCPRSTPECRKGCLATSGRAGMELNLDKKRIMESRIKKTRLFHSNPTYFISWVAEEIRRARTKAQKDGYAFSVRLNGTSDIDYTQILVDGKNIFELFPDVTFYDYTKVPERFNNKPDNYHLTLSYTGRNWRECANMLKKGYNVAAVFNVGKNAPLPEFHKGYEVIDGDITDLRVGEKSGVIIGLRWKDIGNKDLNHEIKNSIFVIQSNV